ncbi:DUF6651 domain-containing protein [Chitinibacter tainanensis]|uniref:DUF6651 domain-containing protein n=1 Tax=Chitinibacter tainanensis TaxID=230667 RepID=UPI0003F9CEF3|nr:DUF6651 domain-containing protein [Chitinibacter tainanensis]
MNKRLLAQFRLHRLLDANDGNGNDLGGGSGGGNGGNANDNTGGKTDDGKNDDASGKSDKKPTDSEAKLLQEVMQKKGDLKKAQDEISGLKEQLKAFEGIDPAAVRKMLEDQRKAEDERLAAAGEFDKLKGNMVKAHQEELGKRDQQITSLTEQLQSAQATINELTVGAAFSNSAFIRDELVLTPAKTRALYGAHFDLDESGSIVAYDKPRGAAGRAPLVDATGSSLAFDVALKKIVEGDADKDTLLRSKIKPGAGSNSDGQLNKGNKQPEVGKGMARISAALSQSAD